MLDTTTQVLFLDDDKELLASLRRSLLVYPATNWEATFCECPVKALNMLQTTAFDIIVTDFKMPNMFGIEFAKKAKKISNRIDIIMLSGEADFNTALDIINGNIICKLLVKPCDASEIFKAIKFCIEKKMSQTLISEITKKMIDQLRFGVIITNRLGRVLYRNDVASMLLKKEEGLLIDRSGVVRCEKGNDTSRLHALFQNLSSNEAHTLLIESVSEGNSNFIVVTKLRDGSENLNLLMISDPENGFKISIDSLMNSFKMPKSEAILAKSLIEGMDIKTAAKFQGITVGSARTYLNRIFSRTSTKSQAELIRKILLVPYIFNCKE